MGIRDALVLLIILGSIPVAIWRPSIGALVWVWVGVMNPHRLGWGVAYDFPVAWAVGGATLLGVLISPDEKKFKGRPEVYALMLFFLWTCITTLNALNPQGAWQLWVLVLKIQLMVFVALFVLNDRRHVILLIWVLVVSLGYYGVKGGIFAVLTGGAYRVWGPADSFIEDNNALGLAQTMNVPLMYFLLQQTQKKWLKVALAVAMGLCALAILSSQSRGAFLAIGAMVILFWWKSSHRLALAFVLPVVVVSALLFMPENWWSRMETITTYQADQSAMLRLMTWKMALNLAMSNPILGGGFALWTEETYSRYADEWLYASNAHSIYLQVLGEHGFVGLFLYLLVWWFTWRNANWLIRNTRTDPELKWAGSLAAMVQVSLLAFGVGGAFLNLAYWDVPYYFLVALVVTRFVVSKQLAPAKGSRPSGEAAYMSTPPKTASISVASANMQEGIVRPEQVK